MRWRQRHTAAEPDETVARTEGRVVTPRRHCLREQIFVCARAWHVDLALLPLWAASTDAELLAQSWFTMSLRGSARLGPYEIHSQLGGEALPASNGYVRTSACRGVNQKPGELAVEIRLAPRVVNRGPRRSKQSRSGFPCDRLHYESAFRPPSIFW